MIHIRYQKKGKLSPSLRCFGHRPAVDLSPLNHRFPLSFFIPRREMHDGLDEKKDPSVYGFQKIISTHALSPKQKKEDFLFF